MSMDYTKYAKVTNEPVEEVVETPVEPEPVPEEPVEPVVEEMVAEPEPEVVPEEPETEPEAPQRKTGRVFNCAKLNVRQEPKATASVVCEISCHTEVEIDEEESTDDFYKIYTASGIEGFCMKSYILEK